MLARSLVKLNRNRVATLNLIWRQAASVFWLGALATEKMLNMVQTLLMGEYLLDGDE